MSGYGKASYGFMPYGGSLGYILGTAKLTIPHHADYTTQAMTIAFDVRITDNNDYATVHKMVAGKEEWGFVQNSGNMNAVMYEGGAANAVVVSSINNIFQTFIGIYDGVDWEFFIDNSSQGSIAVGTRDTSDGQIEICHNGSIRNLRIWDTDLSSADRANVTYNRDIPLTNLVGEWLLIDNAGVVTDSAGSNDGAIVSGTWCGGVHNGGASSVDWETYSADCLAGNNIDWPAVTNGTLSSAVWDVDTDTHQFLQTIGYFYRSDPYDTVKLRLHVEASLDVTLYVHFDEGIPAGIGTSWDRNAHATTFSITAGDDGWIDAEFAIPSVSGEHQLMNMWLSAEKVSVPDEGLLALHQVRLDWVIS